MFVCKIWGTPIKENRGESDSIFVIVKKKLYNYMINSYSMLMIII